MIRHPYYDAKAENASKPEGRRLDWRELMYPSSNDRSNEKMFLQPEHCEWKWILF